MSDSAVVSDTTVFIIQEILIDIGVAGLGQGAFAVLASMAIYTLARKGLRNSLPRQSLLLAVIVLVLSTTVLFSCLWVLCVKDITQIGPNPISTPALLRYLVGEVICTRINYFVSDVIVVWRAWSLSTRRVWHMALAACLVITLGGMIPELFFTIRVAFDTNANSYKNPLLNLLLILPLLVTNLLATSIVAYQTWMYRSQIKAHFKQHDGRSRVEKILILLVESGLLYCAVWILTLVVMFFPNSGVLQELVEIVPFIAGIYPVSIILLVEHGKTDDTSSSTSNGGAGPVTRSIRFASSPNRRPLSISVNSHSIMQSLADHIKSIDVDEEKEAV